jgi:DNA-binding Lrp family transcriptional regulator
MGTLKLSPQDKKLLGQIQGDLPLVLTPFESAARRAGWDEKRLLHRINVFIRRGMIRRFGAILRHQKAGFRGNAMVVWRVPEDRVSQVGQAMASFPAVSHCYLRPPLPDWPFNLYTMVHGQGERDCLRVARKIAEKTGVKDYRLLFSKREHKKSSMRYF